MERIGILGGTFDPPHLGHLWMAEIACEELRLEQVIFMPAGKPPHKTGEPISASSHRLNMTRLAVAGNDRMIVDDMDMKRPPPHTTVTLIPLLKDCFPDAALWLLIGQDSLRDLPDWSRPDLILLQLRIAVMPRPDVVVDWVNLSQAVPGVDHVIDFLPGPSINLSSTIIRERAKTGRTIRYLVPKAVEDYIRAQNLYNQKDFAPSNCF